MAYKILSRALFIRLRPLEESFIDEYQVGFRGSTTHHLFINFKAAYDSVERNELWQIMSEHGLPAKLIRLIRATLDGSKSSIRIADEVSISFVTLDGLKHGDALLNLLLNIALEGAIKRFGVQRNGTIITRSHMLLDFADDIDFIGSDRGAVDEANAPLKRETARIGLTIKSIKTKYMTAGSDRGGPVGVSAEVVIDEDGFQVVEGFC